jgi:uncharacterized protein YkwD
MVHLNGERLERLTQPLREDCLKVGVFGEAAAARTLARETPNRGTQADGNVHARKARIAGKPSQTRTLQGIVPDQHVEQARSGQAERTRMRRKVSGERWQNQQLEREVRRFAHERDQAGLPPLDQCSENPSF